MDSIEQIKIKIKYLLIAIVLMNGLSGLSQAPTAEELVGIHEVTTSEMNLISTPNTGSLVYNSDRKSIFFYDGSQWVNLKPEVFVGKFIITTTGDKIISGLPFKPSKILFVAYENIESYIINADNQVGNNNSGLSNSFGGMNGYAKFEGGAFFQQVISVGGSGNSINDISRYSSNLHCIGLRYGNQNGDNLGVTSAKLVTFNDDGFTINVDSKADNLAVLYTAYE